MSLEERKLKVIWKK